MYAMCNIHNNSSTFSVMYATEECHSMSCFSHACLRTIHAGNGIGHTIHGVSEMARKRSVLRRYTTPTYPPPIPNCGGTTVLFFFYKPFFKHKSDWDDWSTNYTRSTRWISIDIRRGRVFGHGRHVWLAGIAFHGAWCSTKTRSGNPPINTKLCT